MPYLSIFITIAGFVVGLGAVTVIDIHGFLGRASSYWTEATIRTHKVTKPLIWIGIALVTIGHVLMQRADFLADGDLNRALAIIGVLILNGCFLSFVVSPHLLRQEQAGKSGALLPPTLQHKITASFVISFIGWWSLVFLFAQSLVS